MTALIIDLLPYVIPVVAKILEKIVATQLSMYLEQNNLLHPHQGAYIVVGNPQTLRTFCNWRLIILLRHWILRGV